MPSTPTVRPRVVVVGMGDTGVLVSTLVSRWADVVGVSTTDAFVSGQELGSRLARPEQWRRDYLVDYGRYRRLRGVQVVHGEVVAVDPSVRTVRVHRADDRVEDLPYDGLVVASGTTNGFWRSGRVRTRDQVLADLEARAEVVARASSVLVVGGGPSGVSVASNLAERHPGTCVALAHSGEAPLPGYHQRTRRRIVERLRAQGVELLPGHRAVLPPGAERTLEGGMVEWSTGQEPRRADVVVWAVGRITPNSGFLPHAWLDDDGFVRVGSTLEVVGQDRVVAVGDVAATDPNRSSARNFGHRIAAHNLRVLLTGRGRLREFRSPRHRWGSILGIQADGMRIHTPRGGVVPLSRRFALRVLMPVFTHRLIYGGRRSAGRD